MKEGCCKMSNLQNLYQYFKTTTRKMCFEYKTIALMSYTLKLLLSIINARIERTLDENPSETQYDFINKEWNQKRDYTAKVISQKTMNANREIIMGFVDYKRKKKCRLCQL